MAIQNLLPLSAFFLGDGISTSLSIDLKSDPVTVSPAFGGTLVNISSRDLLGATAAYIQPGGPYTVTLSGTSVTITWSVAPPAGFSGTPVQFYLLF